MILFGKLLRYNVISQMQYRINFLLLLPVNLAFTLQEVLFVLVLFTHTGNISGWTKYEYILLLGTYFIVDSLFTSVLLPNIGDLAERIRTGKLDFFLLKPIDSQFLVFTYRFDLGLIFTFFVGVMVILVSLFKLQVSFNPLTFLIYIILIINGALIFASITFILSSFAFHTIKVDYVYDIFLTFAHFSRKPFVIYPKIIRHFVMYVVPLGFIAYVPVGFLLGKIDYLWSYSLLITPILFLISRVVWKHAVKAYDGASS